MNNRSKLMLAASTAIFGTIGIFRRSIPLSSGIVAFVRGVIGALFLLACLAVSGRKLSACAIAKNKKVLLLSGAAIGFNWILLFEAYNYTTVATATLCYYMAPIFVTLASPFVLKEKLTGKKLACVLASLLGMVFVSGILNGGGTGSFAGVLFGLGAAVLYASVMLLNQKLHDIGTYDKTIVQLSAAALVLLPYLALTEDFGALRLSLPALALLLTVGVIHTGVAYALYFGSMEALSVQTVALFSYIDPVVAVLLSALLLKERLGALGIAGAVLILGATLYSELPERK